VAKKKSKIVKLKPTDEHPGPYDTSPDGVTNFDEELAVAANTVTLLEELGAPIEVDARTLEQEKKLIDKVIKEKDTKPLANINTSHGIASFLRTYGQNLALDVTVVRAALTNKLIDLADCGDVRYELKAIEMLGKHSDIGLFTERSEVTINYNSPEALETAIKERVKRLLNAEVSETSLFDTDLDEEFGVYRREKPVDAEFEEVASEEEDTEK